MILLGIDIGSAFVKVSLFDGGKGVGLGVATYPHREMEILSPLPNWAEQDPDLWIENLHGAMTQLQINHARYLKQVQAIGISYQMHGLVAVDRRGNPVRNAIIWCDGRAVEQGHRAFHDLGTGFCLKHLLNSPGNFTASKLSWVKTKEPHHFEKIYKIMLPGDYVAYRLTGEMLTTPAGLSEGIFWDYTTQGVSLDLLHYFGFHPSLIPAVTETFSAQGKLTTNMAGKLGLPPGIPVCYRAGDQPNNAFSLNVLQPGEVAATAGTSGVVYAVTDHYEVDPQSRVNTFLHVNHTHLQNRLGVLLCINAAGITNAWMRQQLFTGAMSYDEMNARAGTVREGSEGLLILPFGNGPERILENRNTGASMHGLNFNIHRKEHLLRALQEGIAFAFNYGLEMLGNLDLNLSVIRAGKANMFLSELFGQTLANVSGATIELYNTSGAEGAARGAGVGAGIYQNARDAFKGLKIIKTLVPDRNSEIGPVYDQWKTLLKNTLASGSS